MKLEGKQIVVTGGAGFLGSHLVDALVVRGAQVTVIDDLSTGRIDNIQAHITAGAVSFLNTDICDCPDLDADIIFNMACPASPRSYQSDPIGTWRTSVIGGARMVEIAHKNKACFVHMSTSEVYGDPLHHPQKETDWGNVNPNGIRACYDEGKRALEALLMDYRRVHGLDVRIARIFNTYGPRMQTDDGRAMPTFLRQARAGEKLSIEGTGAQTRSFCFVSDLIDGIVKMAEVDAAAGEIINLGNPNEITILELCDAIGAHLPHAGLTFIPAASDDPTRRCPDISKAKRILDWEPIVSLDAGLAALVAQDTPAKNAS